MPSLSDIAKHIGGELKGDPCLLIEGISPLETADRFHITFLADKKKHGELAKTKAGAIIIGREEKEGPDNRIVVDDPYWAYAKASELFAETSCVTSGIHETAIIGSGTSFGDDVHIGAYCVIGKNVSINCKTILYHHVVIEDNVSIGDNCIIYTHTTIRKHSRIGNRVIVHPGAVIGSDGFGFAEKNNSYTKIHQLGWVEIQDDVEIGANTCIDRGALGPTIVRKGTKLDNLVHIAHNVDVGENAGIAAQAGISGSVKIGRNVKIAGQAGVAGHLELGNGVFIGAQAGVSKSIPDSAVVTGTPARELKKVRKMEALLYSLPGWIRRIRLLEKKLN